MHTSPDEGPGARLWERERRGGGGGSPGAAMCSKRTCQRKSPRHRQRSKEDHKGPSSARPQRPTNHFVTARPCTPTAFPTSECRFANHFPKIPSSPPEVHSWLGVQPAMVLFCQQQRHTWKHRPAKMRHSRDVLAGGGGLARCLVVLLSAARGAYWPLATLCPPSPGLAYPYLNREGQLPSPLARCIQVDTAYRRWGA